MHISLGFRTIVTAAALICSCATSLGAQESSSVPEKVRKYRLAHENEIVEEFTTLLSIPNLASDMPNIERNAQAITKALESRGVSVQLLRERGAPPRAHWSRKLNSLRASFRGPHPERQCYPPT
jgi:hypothetical protein